ncbi:MAG: hypothetical protein ACRDRW_05390 [Pseudonocardiaceae bacterium]
MATSLMSTAVTSAQPRKAAVTTSAPAPDPTSRSVPPMGYGSHMVNS